MVAFKKQEVSASDQGRGIGITKQRGLSCDDRSLTLPAF
jgi:hypothetical protein